MKKKRMACFAMLCMCLMMIGLPVHLWAAEGKTSLAVSAGTIAKGENVKITAQASGPSGEKMTAAMTISYDTSVFSFVDCSANYSGGNGSITATAASYTITLKAVGEGNSKVSLAASDGTIAATGTKLDSVEGSSTRIQVGSAQTSSEATDKADKTTDQMAKENLSADNSLQSLSLSAGTLSPAFSGKTLQYTASVGNDVTKITVNAVPVNEKASIESITGNENLAVGSNTVKIVVKAENGATATYTVTVTRQQEEASSEKKDEPEVITEEAADTAHDTEQEAETVNGTKETVQIGETSYQVVSDFSSDMLPTGCEESTVSYKGTDYRGAVFAAGNISMLCLLPEGTADSSSARFYLYDESGDSFYPLIQLRQGEHFIIWLPTPADYTAFDGEQQTDIVLNDGTAMSVHQLETEIGADFSFFYAVNQNGAAGWYEYDALEQTYQRQHGNAAAESTDGSDESNLSYLQEQYSTLESEMKKEKSFARTTIGVLVFIVAVLLIIIINLFLRSREEDYEYDFEDEDENKETEQIDESESSIKKLRKKALREPFSDDLEEEPIPKSEKRREKKREIKQEHPQEQTRFSDELEEPLLKEEKKIQKSRSEEDDEIEIIDLNDL